MGSLNNTRGTTGFSCLFSMRINAIKEQTVATRQPTMIGESQPSLVVGRGARVSATRREQTKQEKAQKPKKSSFAPLIFSVSSCWSAQEIIPRMPKGTMRKNAARQ